MNQPLSQLKERIQESSTANNNRCDSSVRKANTLTQPCDHRGFAIPKEAAKVVFGILLVVAAAINSERMQTLSREVTCGRVISTIRIGKALEMHTEVEKRCEKGISESAQ